MKRLWWLFFPMLCLIYSEGAAVSVKKWTHQETRQTGKGQYLGVMYSAQGDIIAGFDATPFRFRENFTFRAAILDENNLPLFGGGSPAHILNFDGDQFISPIRYDIYSEGLYAVSALAVSPDKEYIIAAYTGSGVIAVKEKAYPAWVQKTVLPAENIWSLEFVAADTILAATGPLGQIYQVRLNDGAYEAWGQTEDVNIRFILKLASGRIIFGGGESGNLYELKAKDRIEVIYHFPEEVVEKAIEYGTGLLVALNRMKQSPEKDQEKQYRQYFKQFSALKDSFGVASPISESMDAGVSRWSNLAGGAIYHVGDDYRVEHILTLDDYLLDMAVDQDGRLFLATGPNGKVYLIENPLSDSRKTWIAHDFEYKNVTNILMRQGYPEFFAVSGNEAVVYQRAAAKSETGHFITQVFSPGTPSDWGKLYWQGEQVAAFSRHGNTPAPDDTWTPWIERPQGSPGELAPSVWNFSQLRFNIGVAGRLIGFSYYYIEKNQRPLVTEVTVSPQKNSDQGVIRVIEWRMVDPNQDALECEVWIKEESFSQWIRVDRFGDIKENRYHLKTDLLPDGHYTVKIIANDDKSNFGAGLTGFGLSEVFTIDNSRPEISDLVYQADQRRIVGEVRDTFSVISELAYSLNGGEWAPFRPLDGILDQLQELISLPLPDNLVPGPQVIAIRAVDEAGNKASAMLQFDFE